MNNRISYFLWGISAGIALSSLIDDGISFYPVAILVMAVLVVILKGWSLTK